MNQPMNDSYSPELTQVNKTTNWEAKYILWKGWVVESYTWICMPACSLVNWVKSRLWALNQSQGDLGLFVFHLKGLGMFERKSLLDTS